ncbi:hypothetical protein [Microbaculum marinum]|uniref:Oligosaccharide repeat unit polymerase n=1 Tax=Microbaculum marinum TaxID=1764581 RepID=A0AAW9RV77_9HYPH
MTLSVATCFGALLWLLWLLRRDRVSLGLPVAYMILLLLIHVPGATAHIVGDGYLGDPEPTRIGIRFTAIGAISFVVGVIVARLVVPGTTMVRPRDNRPFFIFCIGGGWFFNYGLGFLARIPSLGAAIVYGGAVWMLGVMLGLRAAIFRGDAKWLAIWFGALAVYPVLSLLLGGFLSYGTAATVISCCILTISTRSPFRAVIGLALALVLGFNLFLSYFQNRTEIRGTVWGGAAIEQRVDATFDMFRDFEFFDPSNPLHLIAIDQRLNQNYFAGLAAIRISEGSVDYLHGRSVWEGLMSLVPRALWPSKPVFGGSPEIVADMTGLVLSPTSSFGVGNVMEFQINFGVPGLVIGFVALGLLIGLLDRKAAVAENEGNLPATFLYFLPAVALIQPGGSMVEMLGGAAAALVAAFGWKWLWVHWGARKFAQRQPQANYGSRRFGRGSYRL